MQFYKRYLYHESLKLAWKLLDHPKFNYNPKGLINYKSNHNETQYANCEHDFDETCYGSNLIVTDLVDQMTLIKISHKIAWDLKIFQG